MRMITAWIAGIGSLFIPGLGLLYSRRFLWAYCSIPIILIPTFVMGWSDWIYHSSGFSSYIVATLVLFLAVALLATVMSVKHAKKRGARATWFHYPVFIVFTLLLINPFTIQQIRENIAGFNYYRVSSSAMSPTLNHGDIVIVDTWRYKVSEVENNDVILFSPPKPFDDLNVKWLMRIVAKQGDSVGIIDKHVEVNGKSLKDSIIVGHNIPDGTRVLDKEQFFVLGDNRRNSNDSRYWGLLPQSRIYGKARLVVYTENAGLTYREIGLL